MHPRLSGGYGEASSQAATRVTRLRDRATVLAVPARRVLIALTLVALSACTSSSASSRGLTGPEPPPGKPGPVSGLKVTQPHLWPSEPSKWQTVLHWTAPVPAPDHYEVIRNDKAIAKDVSSTSYTDDTALPSTHYRYRVEAVDAAGQTGTGANAVMKTGAPSLASARLDGRFFASLTVTSSTLGMHSGGDRWLFSAICNAGPCNVHFSRSGSSTSGTLTESGPNYGGTVSIPFHISNCFGSAVNESVTVHLTVTDAAVVHGEWQATRLTGTAHEYLAYSGCVSASADYSVKATVQT